MRARRTSTPRTASVPPLAVWFGLLWLLLPACRTASPKPDLGGIYNRAARHHDALRNPVIVIPGILGSRLVEPQSGTVVWGAFGGRYANPHTPEGARLAALPMKKGADLRDLRDEVVPDGVLDTLKVRLLGLPLELQAYLEILRALGTGGYRDQSLALSGAIDYGEGHFTCFQFDYDWRRDNVENAVRLDRFIQEKKAYVEGEIRRRFGVNREVKFDLVAHSMGGLLARYYLMYGTAELTGDGPLPETTWVGARHVERAVFIGTPNAGSVEAVLQLVNGIRFAPIFHKYEAALLSTFPSIYQLFPRARHGALVRAFPPRPPEGASARPDEKLDPFEVRLWEEMQWGLASPAEDGTLELLLPEVEDRAARREIALDHLRKCLDRARRFSEALDRQTSPPPGLRLYLMAGDAHPTAETAAVDRATGALKVLRQGPGDRTVLRSSALLDERQGAEWRPALVSPIRWHQTFFLFTDHLGLTRDPAFTDNILYLLLEDPR